MKKILSALSYTTLMLWGGMNALAVDPEQTAFGNYKQEVLKNPALIRYYTFEDGYGDEATNHVVLEPGRIAQTGGPAGSLTLHSPNPYHIIYPGNTYSEHMPDMVPIAWTTGRYTWKSAVRTGETAMGLFRSGISGHEFSNGMTFAGWIRMENKDASGNIFCLGNGNDNGFKLLFQQNVHAPNGALEFRIGGKVPTILQASPCNPEVWHHLAVTVGNGIAKLYIDGICKAEKTFDGTIIPVEVKDNPDNLPFFENGSNVPLYLAIGANPRGGKELPKTRFDLDELAIYNRALSPEMIRQLGESAPPSGTADEQRLAYAKLRKNEALLAQIRMEIPVNSDGYFRINTPIPATISVPAAMRGDFKAVLELETLYGKSVACIEKKISGGQQITENLRFPACGVYWLDMKLLNSEGKLVKRIPAKFGIGIVPPAPDKLTEHNPVAYWADWYSKFCYDTPLRRMQYHDNGEHFESIYSIYQQRIPGFRAYLWFYSNYIVPPKEGWEAGRNNNKLFFEQAAKRIAGKNIIAFEMTSEPHDINPKWYVQHLADARKIFNDAGLRQPMIPPGGAPPSIPMISDILKAGGDKYMDGISYHPYNTRPIQEYLYNNSIERLKKVTAQYPNKSVIFWNTESGTQALPRIKYRPMTRDDALAAKMQEREGTFLGYISQLPEIDVANVDSQDVLMSLLSGYKIYTRCQGAEVRGNPSLNQVALTAIAGQILNHFDSISRVPLAGLTNMCLIIKQTDGSRIAAVFSEKPEFLTLSLAPSMEYKTMDVFGNYGKVKTDAEGLLVVNSSPSPFYIFNVPEKITEIVPLTLDLPEKISERGELNGNITVSNPYRMPLKGVLSVRPVPGMDVRISQPKVNIAPGMSQKLELSVLGKNLRNQKYEFCVDLKDEQGRVLASVSKLAQSSGVIRMVPLVKSAMLLDGDEAKWEKIPAIGCDSVENVVHGKPNYAEVWLPQWLGKKDLSFSVKICWRKGDGIYFLLKVTDDVVLPAPNGKEGQAFLYDCLEFFFDSRITTQQGTAISDGADQAIVIPQNSAESSPCSLWFARRDKEHINLRCVGRKTADGYLIEGKIMPNDKSAFRVRAGSQFRMDFLVDDTDKDDVRWRRKSAMALDGQFSNYIQSDMWGRYELSMEMVK